MMETERGRLARIDLLVVVLLFLGCLALYALFWRAGWGDYFGRVFGDVALNSAERVQSGDIPYRDFWTMYAPGSFYLLAWLFDLFGNHYLVSTVASSTLCALAACLCYLLVVDLQGSRIPALACALLLFAATLSTAYYDSLTPFPPTIVLVLCAHWSMVRFYRAQTAGWLFTAGLVTGAVILFKHDVGGYTAIAITGGLLLAFIPRLHTFTVRSWSPLPALLLYASGVALVAVPVAVYFAVLAGHDMWYDLIVFPATDFHYTRGEHYPELIPVHYLDKWWLRTVFNICYNLQFTLLFIIVVLAAAWMALNVWRRRVDHVPVAAAFFIGYLLHYASAHVQINTNILSMAAYSTMLGAIALVDTRRHAGPVMQRLSQVLAVVLTLVLLFAYQAETFYYRLRDKPQTVTLTLPKLSGLQVSPDMAETLRRLVTFVDTHVPRDEKIFVGLNRHDTTVIGDGKMYFILDRANATRQDQLHPGIVDTARVQRQMIRDLERNHVRYIIRRYVFSDAALDKLRKYWSVVLPNSGSHLLDDYLQAHYHRVESVGQYEIWGRDDLPPDPAVPQQE